MVALFYHPKLSLEIPYTYEMYNFIFVFLLLPSVRPPKTTWNDSFIFMFHEVLLSMVRSFCNIDTHTPTHGQKNDNNDDDEN